MASAAATPFLFVAEFYEDICLGEQTRFRPGPKELQDCNAKTECFAHSVTQPVTLTLCSLEWISTYHYFYGENPIGETD